MYRNIKDHAWVNKPCRDTEVIQYIYLTTIQAEKFLNNVNA